MANLSTLGHGVQLALGERASHSGKRKIGTIVTFAPMLLGHRSTLTKQPHVDIL